MSNGNTKNRILLTVSGTVRNMDPAGGRPGCVLEMSNGRDTGRYYVPLSPHDCRIAFPEGRKAVLKVWADAAPGKDGSIDTAGNAERLWDVVGAGK